LRIIKIKLKFKMQKRFFLRNLNTLFMYKYYLREIMTSIKLSSIHFLLNFSHVNHTLSYLILTVSYHQDLLD